MKGSQAICLGTPSPAQRGGMGRVIRQSPTSTPSSAQRGKGGMGVRKIVKLSRALRSSPTEAERRIWQHLRERQVEGFRFRRQRPIGAYIVDFICLEAKLIVELDGGQHADALAYDGKRTAYLAGQGFTVVRFWNNQVLSEMQGVLESIRIGLLAHANNPTPTLPLKGEGDSSFEGERCPTPTLPLKGEGDSSSEDESGRSTPTPLERRKKMRGDS